MRKIYLLGALGAWLACTSIGSAQMSTFPPPPPLASPSRTFSDPTTNRPGPTSAAPDANSQNQGDNTPANPAAAPGTVNADNGVPAAAGIISSMSALDDKIALQPGDRISFRVIEDKDLAVPRLVTDTGEVDFPYVGRVKIQGETCHQVAVELKRLLEVDYYKQATVIVGLDVIANRKTDKDKEKPKDLAWIVGQVRQVGPQELSKTQPMTVSQIILRAGGFGDFAEQRQVKIVHRSGPTSSDTDTTQVASVPGDTQIVDVKAVFEGKSKDDPIIKPNDYIIVPKRAVNF